MVRQNASYSRWTLFVLATTLCTVATQQQQNLLSGVGNVDLHRAVHRAKRTFKIESKVRFKIHLHKDWYYPSVFVVNEQFDDVDLTTSPIRPLHGLLSLDFDRFEAINTTAAVQHGTLFSGMSTVLSQRLMGRGVPFL